MHGARIGRGVSTGVPHHARPCRTQLTVAAVAASRGSKASSGSTGKPKQTKPKQAAAPGKAAQPAATPKAATARDIATSGKSENSSREGPKTAQKRGRGTSQRRGNAAGAVAASAGSHWRLYEVGLSIPEDPGKDVYSVTPQLLQVMRVQLRGLC